MKFDPAAVVGGITGALVRQRAISQKQGADLRREFDDSEEVYYEDFLLRVGLVDRPSLLKALSSYFQIPAFDVQGYFFDTFELRKFPKGFLHRSIMIPLEQDEDVMIMVAARPNDQDLLPRIGEYISNDIVYYVGISCDIMDAITEFYDPSLTEGFEKALNQEKQSLEMLRLERERRIIDGR